MLKLAFVSLSGCKFFIQISYLIDMWINKYIMKTFAILKREQTVKAQSAFYVNLYRAVIGPSG